jgi:hypothetical protein
MSQLSLKDLLGKIETEGKKAFDDAKAGVAPTGDWRSDLPLNLEYRLVVDSAEYKPSKSTGNPQIVLTYQVQEPAEFAGAKFQDYQSANPTTSIGVEVLAKLFGALQADVSGWGDNFEGFVKQFEGRTVVAALRLWGQENDRIGIRYVNLDKGQNLRTDVKPKGGSAAKLNTAADIQIPKGPFEDAAPAEVVTPPQAAPAPSGGPNLPPGLR